MYARYTTNILVYRSLCTIRSALFVSFQDSFGPCLRLFVSVRRISEPNLLPTSLFFLLALPSWRILPPRRSLSEELRRVDGDAIKESGSFDERTETSMEEATAYPLPPLNVQKFVYANSHSARLKKARRRAPKNISRPLGFLFQSFGGECRLT